MFLLVYLETLLFYSASSQDDEAAALLKTFELDFDLASNPTIRRLQPFMAKLVKWAKIFDARSSLLPKTELLPNVSQFLSCFASRAVVVDVPSENFSGKVGTSILFISTYNSRKLRDNSSVFSNQFIFG